MLGSRNGFVGLCRKDESIPVSIAYQCIIHQEALCTKVVSFKHVMNVVTKTINSIRSVSLKHRLFKALLEGVESEHSDLLDTEVRCLSMGEVVSRFLELIPQIQDFLQSRNETYEQLTDPCWLLDLSCLTYLNLKLNMLNLELQGKDKHISEMISSVRAFRAKLTLWISDIKHKTLLHFPHLKKVMSEAGTEENFEPLPLVGHLENLKEEFQRRFQEFSSIETVIKFVVHLFNAVDVSETATLIANLFQADVGELELEIINIQSDIVLLSY
jgi:hypothetical protein